MWPGGCSFLMFPSNTPYAGHHYHNDFPRGLRKFERQTRL